MRLWKRKAAGTRRPAARSREGEARRALLEALDSLAETNTIFGQGAAAMAEQVRRRGRAAIRDQMREFAPFLSMDAASYSRMNPLIGAFVAYEHQATGVNLTAAPSEPARQRGAATAYSAVIARAAKRRNDVLADAEERGRERQLAELRSWATGRTRVPEHVSWITPTPSTPPAYRQQPGATLPTFKPLVSRTTSTPPPAPRGPEIRED